jgi:hypothetical protein
VNLNSAPVPVLRALPGMTDATINMIVQLRSQGRRIENINQIAQAAPGGRPRPGQLGAPQLTNALAGRTTTEVRELEVTFESRVGPQARPSKLTVVLSRGNDATVTYKQW